MLRTTVIRATQDAARRNLLPLATRASFPRLVRFHSNEGPSRSHPEQQAWKEALKRSDDLQRDWDAKILTYEMLKPKTTSPTPDTYLIDVREPDEVIQGMIPSAVNLPLSELATALNLSRDAFKAKYGFEKPTPQHEVIFYCRSGKRSASASDVAKRNGFVNIANYQGSWLDWVERESKKST